MLSPGLFPDGWRLTVALAVLPVAVTVHAVVWELKRTVRRVRAALR